REIEGAGEREGTPDLRRAMRPPVDLENVVVEVLDAEAEASHAHLADRGQLALGERDQLALERDLLGVLPRRHRGEASDETLELLGRQERGRAAAKVDE